MTPEEIIAAFERHGETEYIEFHKVVNPLSTRPDLCAFLILDRLCPGTSDLISASEHDTFYLDIDLDSLSAITDDDILTLVRCGVMYDDDLDSLYMLT